MTRCALTPDVQQAAIRGTWTPALDAHAVSCGVCRDVAVVARALADAGSVPLKRTDPRALWISAHHVRRWRAASRIERLGTAAHVVTLAVVAAGTAWLPSSWVTVRAADVLRLAPYTCVPIGALAVLAFWIRRARAESHA